MLSLILIELICLVLIFKFLYNKFKNSNLPLPPGPRGLPLLGYMPFLGRSPYLKLTQLTQKYGEIIMINVGRERTVVINSLDAMKEAYVQVSSVDTGWLLLVMRRNTKNSEPERNSDF